MPRAESGIVPFQDAPHPHERRQHIAIAKLRGEEGRLELGKKYAQSNMRYQLKAANNSKMRFQSKVRQKDKHRRAGAAQSVARALSVIRYSGIFQGGIGVAGKGSKFGKNLFRSDASIIRNIATDLGGLFRRHKMDSPIRQSESSGSGTMRSHRITGQIGIGAPSGPASPGVQP